MLPHLSQIEKNFLLKFFAGFSLLYLLVQILPLEAFLQWLASTEAVLLNSAGVNALASATIISTPAIEFEIIRDCSGLLMVALLAALLYATNSRNSLKTLLLFAPLLVAFNLFRLLITLFVGTRFGSGALEAVHFSLWIVDSLIVLLIWARAEGILESELTFAVRN